LVLLRTTYTGALNNLGLVLQYQGQSGRAAACFSRALHLNPDSAETQLSGALLLLLCGDFEYGWPALEWRWKTGKLPLRYVDYPQWNGEPLGNKSILLHAEQGLGDTIQFIRYAPLVKALGGDVLVECQKPLKPLLASCPGVDQLIAEGNQAPAFDFHLPLMGLPRVFNTELASIPAGVPYVFADQGLVKHWRSKLAAWRGFRIGIHWQSKAGQSSFRSRNIPLECFAFLNQIPGITLISLQKSDTPSELKCAGVRVVNLGNEIDSVQGAFVDTAAIMMNLDLVITSDTAIAHLAGALGVSVWVALAYAADWRWLLDRSDSPWYPSMRLFRQKKPGDWTGVFEEIRAALDENTA
jgi:hypothetical protein